MKDMNSIESMLERKSNSKEYRSPFSFCSTKRLFFRFFCIFILIISFIFFFTHSFEPNANPLTYFRDFLKKETDNLTNIYHDNDHVSPYTLTVRSRIRYYLNDSDAMLDFFHPFNVETLNITISLSNNYSMVPNLRISSCAIPEALSLTLMNVFCYLFDSKGFIKDGSDIIMNYDQEHFCGERNQVSTFEDMNRIMPFNYSTLTVVRHPVYRFVSSFLRYCTKKENDWNEICYYCLPGDLGCVIERLFKNIASSSSFWQSQLTVKYVLNIWAPQTWHCSMDITSPSLSFIRYLETDEERPKMFTELTRELLRTKVPKKDVEFIEERLNVGVRSMKNLRSLPEAMDIFQQLQENATLYNLLTTIYRYDYKVFGFKKTTADKL